MALKGVTLAQYDRLLDKLLKNSVLGCDCSSKPCSVEDFRLAKMFQDLVVLGYGWVLKKELGMAKFWNWVWQVLGVVGIRCGWLHSLNA